MKRIQRQPARRAPFVRWAALLLAALVSGTVFFPVAAYAGCDGGLTMDIGACIDGTQYTIWKGPTVMLWQGNQILLLGAHQIDQLRWFLLDQVFLSLYRLVAELFTPLIQPLALLALIVALLAIIATPLFGRAVIGNIRQVVALCILVPILLTEGGPLVVELEHARTDLVTALLADMRTQLPSRLAPLFGGAGGTTDMASPTALAFTACGGTNYVPRTGIGLQDLAAATLWADWVDINCPQNAGTEHPELPARWTEPSPTGPAYLYNGDLGDVGDAHERAKYIANIQLGFARVAWALVPSLIALLEAAIQFVFSLCLMLLACVLPIVLLFSFFQQSFGGIGQLATGAIQVLKVSFSVSAALSLLVVALNAAAQAGNALGYMSLAGATLFLMMLFGVVALLTLKDCVLAAATSVEASTGVQTTAPLQMAQTTAATVAGAALTGGATLIAGGGIGYALGMAASTTKPLAQVGALASAMGAVPESVEQGLYTGTVHGRGEGMTMRALHVVRRDVQMRQNGTENSVAGGSSNGHSPSSATQQAAGHHAVTTPTIPLRPGLWLGGIDIAPANNDHQSTDPLSAQVRTLREAQPAQADTPFRREIALRQRASTQQALYERAAQEVQTRERRARQQGDGAEGAALAGLHEQLTTKATRAGAIAREGSAGIPHRPSLWTSEQRAERRFVYQAALLEAQGEAAIEVERLDTQISVANDRLGAIPAEIANVRAVSDQAALTAATWGTPKDVQQHRAEAEDAIRALTEEQQMLAQQRQRDRSRRTLLTPQKGETIAPAVRRQAARIARTRLDEQDLTADQTVEHVQRKAS